MHNEVLLTRELLYSILTDLAQRLWRYFAKTVDIVVHGGVVMVLHPWLASRKSTRDVDYNHRSFVLEWAKRGMYDADARMKKCIAATAQKFGLGADWMNACADVALPMSKEYVHTMYSIGGVLVSSQSDSQIRLLLLQCVRPFV